MSVCTPTYFIAYFLGPACVYHSLWSVNMADNFAPAKRDESFSAMFAEP